MNYHYHYILDGKLPKPVEFKEWLEWFVTNPEVRQVAFTEFEGGNISTVFLGMAPMLFETMVFGGEHHLLQRRYATWDEAIAGHEEIEKMCL